MGCTCCSQTDVVEDKKVSSDKKRSQNPQQHNIPPHLKNELTQNQSYPHEHSHTNQSLHPAPPHNNHSLHLQNLQGRSSVSESSQSQDAISRMSQIQQQIADGNTQSVDLNMLFQLYVILRGGNRQSIDIIDLISFIRFLQLLQSLPESRGLSQAQINSLQRRIATNDDKDCPVCQDSIKTGEQILVLPCNHPFHTSCITQWIEKSNKCPICRRQIQIDQ